MRLYALNTKLRAMRGALFTKGDYEAVCRLDSVQKVADFLREKDSYRRLLTHGEGEWRRREIEHSIISAIYSDFFRLRLYVTDTAAREFLRALFMRTLISLIKKLLCMVYDDRDTSHEFNEWDTAFAKEQNINLPRLAASKTVPEFVSHLRDSVFHERLRAAASDSPALFELEQELDIFYYQNIWAEVNKLDGANREIMREIIGTEIDLRNILWVYRFKKYYDVPPGIILAGLTPINYKISAESVRSMANSKTADGVMDEVWKGHYRHVFEDSGNPESDFTREIRRRYRAAIRTHPFSLAVAASYLFEKTEEINNITTALEGVRYSLPASEILDYIYL